MSNFPVFRVCSPTVLDPQLSGMMILHTGSIKPLAVMLLIKPSPNRFYCTKYINVPYVPPVSFRMSLPALPSDAAVICSDLNWIIAGKTGVVFAKPH